jgi:hypothetical protein
MNDDVMVIVGVRVVRVRVLLLRRCWSGDGERQRRHPDRRPGQKNSAEWHETTPFNFVSRYRSKLSFRVFSEARYSEQAPKIKLCTRLPRSPCDDNDIGAPSFILSGA